MKILYINGMGPRDKAPLGGIFVTQRIRALKALGAEVIPVNAGTVYTPFTSLLLGVKHIRDGGNLLDKQLGADYQTAAAKMNLMDTWGTRTGSKTYEKVLFRQMYPKLFKLCDADLIHLHWCWPVGLIVPELARKKHIPYVLTFHGSDINIQLQSPVIRPALLRIMESAASVEFISRALFERAVASGYSGRNGIVIYNGIDTTVFHQKPCKKIKKCVGFAGGLLPVKGADRLPGIFRKIQEKYPEELSFVIAGQGPLEKELRQKLKGLPVTFTGQLLPDRLADVYNHMDVLIVPSRSEGYACVIKEAQACGVIPVGNDVGGIREAVDGCGSVVAEEDEEKLSEAFADEAVGYLEGRLTVDLEEMERKAGNCSWTERQKESMLNYERILNSRHRQAGR